MLLSGWESSAHMIDSKAKPVDVICQHSRDGGIIPLRVRVRDEEGEFQTYRIQAYKDLSHRGTRENPDGVFVTDNTFVFECAITVFGLRKVIRLYYEPNNNVWKMTA